MDQSNQTRRESQCRAAEERCKSAQTRHTTAGARSAAAAAAGAVANAAKVAKDGGGGVGGGVYSGGGGGRRGGGESDKRLKTDVSETMLVLNSANKSPLSREQEEKRTLELAKKISLHNDKEQPNRGFPGLFLSRMPDEKIPMYKKYTTTEPPFRIVVGEMVDAPMLLGHEINELQCEENRCTVHFDPSCDKYVLALTQGLMTKNTHDVITIVEIGNAVIVGGDDEISLGPNCNFKMARTHIVPSKHGWDAGGQGGAL